MTKPDFKIALIRLDMNQGEFAKKIKVAPETLSRNLRLDSVPVLYEYAIRFLCLEAGIKL